jgi:hypothetical protein
MTAFELLAGFCPQAAKRAALASITAEILIVFFFTLLGPLSSLFQKRANTQVAYKK